MIYIYPDSETDFEDNACLLFNKHTSMVIKGDHICIIF